MDPQTSPTKSNPWKKDLLFACSMLVAVCMFVIALSGVPFWSAARDRQKISAEATSTAFALATQHANQRANATATAIAHTAEQAQYQFTDSFNNNRRNWGTGYSNDEYSRSSTTVSEGAYVWKITEVKESYVQWEDFPGAGWVGDFDVYIDSKVEATDGSSTSICSGFVFRAASEDWEKGAYVFSVCHTSYFCVDYYEQGEWEAISGEVFSNVIRNSDWNRLEIRARGDQFMFFINNEQIYEMTDDRLPRGGLALFADINEKKPVTIFFDNAGFQPR